MPEPLRGKVFDKYGTGRKDDILLFLKEDVKSAIQFYKRYVHDFALLKKEHPEIYGEMMEWAHEPNHYYFVDWLFDYVFGDAIDV